MTSLFRFTGSVLAIISLALPATAHDENKSNPDIFTVEGSEGFSLEATPLETFNGPWAMTFLPDGQALVTEKSGAMWLLDATGHKVGKISNTPTVVARNQGGLGDIIIHPDFASNGTVFISYVERDAEDDSLSGAVVERATINLTSSGGILSNREVIWHQSPKVTGNGHYGHRMAIAPDGHLFISSGERQKFTPAQNMDMNLGKIIRINQDGSIPKDNPFYGNGEVANQVWSLGHRNPLGIAFDAAGQLWEQEMGPKHGDELNMIVRSENYGYPVVSDGDHYSGVEIPDHEDFPIYKAPVKSWVPAISPAGLIIYSGDMFEDWQGDAFIGGLSSEALIRIEFSKDDKGQITADEAARYEWGKRIREVEQGPDGAIYVLEDKTDARLIRLEPIK